MVARGAKAQGPVNRRGFEFSHASDNSNGNAQ
jgi:hypothetical protein